MLALIVLLVASQLLAASCMSPVEHTQTELSSYDTLLYQQLFGFDFDSNESPEKRANFEFLAKLRAIYPQELAHQKLTSDRVKEMVRPKDCDRENMKQLLAIAVSIHNDHFEFTDFMQHGFQKELTECLKHWFPHQQIEDPHISVLMKSIDESRADDDDTSKWTPLSRSLLEDALGRLAFTKYGNEHLEPQHFKSIAQLRENFEHQLSSKLLESCRQVDNEWHVIGRAWLILAEDSDDVEISSPEFKRFIEKFDACSAIIDEPSLIESFVVAKYSYLDEQLFSNQISVSLTPDQTVNGMQVVFDYFEENGIEIVNKEMYSTFLYNLLDDHIRPGELKSIHENITNFNNENIAQLAREKYHLHIPSMLALQRMSLIRSIDDNIRLISDQELKQLDQLLALVEKFRVEAGSTPEFELNEQIEEEPVSKALAHFYLPKEERCTDKLLECFGGKSIVVLSDPKIHETFGNICGVISRGPMYYEEHLRELAETDLHRVKEYINEKRGLMLWMRRIRLCHLLYFNHVNYELANEFLNDLTK